MKYFFDTEFIEGFTQPLLFGRKRHFIDLISIGIKCEDGREYYAISKEFRPLDANEWVHDNVLPYLYDKDGDKREPRAWKSNAEIAGQIREFVMTPIKNKYDNRIPETLTGKDEIEFYAYFCAYDWVLFCSLFGSMSDLPLHFPHYCNDLKQMMKDRGLDKKWKDAHCPLPNLEHHALEDAKWNFRLYNKLTKIK